MARVKRVSEWQIVEEWAYNTHLPGKFSIEGNEKDVRSCFHNMLHCFDGPCRSRWGAHHFFSYRDVQLKEILKSKEEIIIHVEENPGHGTWRDAVYMVRKTSTDSWMARLVLVGDGHSRDGKAYGHNKFVLHEIKNHELEFTRLWFAKDITPIAISYHGRGEQRTRIDVRTGRLVIPGGS